MIFGSLFLYKNGIVMVLVIALLQNLEDLGYMAIIDFIDSTKSTLMAD